MLGKLALSLDSDLFWASDNVLFYSWQIMRVSTMMTGVSVSVRQSAIQRQYLEVLIIPQNGGI